MNRGTVLWAVLAGIGIVSCLTVSALYHARACGMTADRFCDGIRAYMLIDRVEGLCRDALTAGTSDEPLQTIEKDGYTYMVGDWVEGVWHGGMQDEEALLNPSFLDHEITGNLFRRVGTVSDMYLNYMDGKRRLYGNARLSCLEELLCAGYSGRTVALLSRLCTAWGEGRININSVDTDVLEVIGFTALFAQRLQTFRAGSDGIKGTDDDRVFQAGADIVQDLIAAGVAVGKDRITLLKRASLFKTWTSCYRASVWKRRGMGRPVRIGAFIFHCSGADISVLRWRAW